MQSKVALDFAPGLHGHFLEYVLNRYIFQIGISKKSIFQSSGACHPINLDQEYQNNKIVKRLHYSAFDNGDSKYPADINKVVFIQHDKKFDFILLTNMYYRCHPNATTELDFNIEEIKKLQESMMFGNVASASELRNNWYNKLVEHRFELTDKKIISDLPTFNFDFGSFFTLDSFLLEIRKVADFLEHTFVFEQSLVELWKEFISQNQGFQLWTHGNNLFEKIVSGIDVEIDPDWKVHAYINYKLSTIFNLYDDPKLFGILDYPTSTKEVTSILMDHITNFDDRFR